MRAGADHDWCVPVVPSVGNFVPVSALASAALFSLSWPMFSAFLYFLAMAFTIPVLPKVVNELVTGSKAVSTFVESNGGMVWCGEVVDGVDTGSTAAKI